MWLNGKRSNLVALMGNSAQAQRPAGTVTVAMGFRDERVAEVAAPVEAGKTTVVRCDLVGVIACRAEASPAVCTP